MSEAPATEAVAAPVAQAEAPSDDDALNARVAEKRARAEKMPVGEQQASEERGPDGKFKPRGRAAKAEAKPEAKAEAKPEAKDDGEAAKLKAENAAHAARIAELEERDSKWESLAEHSLARINALEALIERMQKQGAQIPEHDAQNVAQAEELERYKLAEQRQAYAKKAKEEAEKKQAAEQAVEGLRSSLATIVAKHPELKPEAGAPSLDFWRIVTEAHQNGGAAEARRVAERISETFARAIRAQAAPAPLPVQARTLASMGGTGGGAARDLSPEGIREKYAARMRAH